MTMFGTFDATVYEYKIEVKVIDRLETWICYEGKNPAIAGDAHRAAILDPSTIRSVFYYRRPGEPWQADNTVEFGWRQNTAPQRPRDEIDLDLLRKFAIGEGGRRTGAMMRGGYLECKVTERGLRALKDAGIK